MLPVSVATASATFVPVRLTLASTTSAAAAAAATTSAAASAASRLISLLRRLYARRYDKSRHGPVIHVRWNFKSFQKLRCAVRRIHQRTQKFFGVLSIRRLLCHCRFGKCRLRRRGARFHHRRDCISRRRRHFFRLIFGRWGRWRALRWHRRTRRLRRLRRSRRRGWRRRRRRMCRLLRRRRSRRRSV